ncbi:MAG TPA: RsmD family RNA methyltransferase [Phycisphaerae bacterium]|nr:RsmD family RNA methyltransferase [Phycisphaerae bacterium]HRY67313.1 RsmD family RNA methyltransferase [Phycisphaerae bacterium]HSA28456.1 RsmD family RNA methyltransferase [Phycisphaerae bacterium]
MRIIAGQWRGRRIELPPGDQTRPILDRVKTVLFDLLGHMLAMPGRLPSIAVLDLFAGTGSLGLEALSRGARFCRFAEQHRATAALLRKNLDALGVIREAEVFEGDATAADLKPPPAAGNLPAQYELIFLDPPYRMLAGACPAPAMTGLLERLAGSPVIAESALFVVRHDARSGVHPDLSPLVETSSRVVGTMVLRFLARSDTRSSQAVEAAP